jgi:hypothetical protein
MNDLLRILSTEKGFKKIRFLPFQIIKVIFTKIDTTTITYKEKLFFDKKPSFESLFTETLLFIIYCYNKKDDMVFEIKKQAKNYEEAQKIIDSLKAYKENMRLNQFRYNDKKIYYPMTKKFIILFDEGRTKYND